MIFVRYPNSAFRKVRVDTFAISFLQNRPIKRSTIHRSFRGYAFISVYILLESHFIIGIQLYCAHVSDGENEPFDNEKFWSDVCSPTDFDDHPSVPQEASSASISSLIPVPHHDIDDSHRFNHRLPSAKPFFGISDDSATESSEDEDEDAYSVIESVSDSEEPNHGVVKDELEDSEGEPGDGESGGEEDSLFSSGHEIRAATSRKSKIYFDDELHIEVKLHNIFVDTKLPTRVSVHAAIEVEGEKESQGAIDLPPLLFSYIYQY